MASSDNQQPYEDLPGFPPRSDTETAPILKQCLKASRALAQLVFRQPYCKISFLVDAGIVKRRTAAYLNALEEAGVLGSEVVGRERINRDLSMLLPCIDMVRELRGGHGHVLTSGRYFGAEELDAAIGRNLEVLGYRK